MVSFFSYRQETLSCRGVKTTFNVVVVLNIKEPLVNERLLPWNIRFIVSCVVNSICTVM